MCFDFDLHQSKQDLRGLGQSQLKEAPMTNQTTQMHAAIACNSHATEVAAPVRRPQTQALRTLLTEMQALYCLVPSLNQPAEITAV